MCLHADGGSNHGNLINRCPTYQRGIRLHSMSGCRVVRRRRRDGSAGKINRVEMKKDNTLE